MGFDGTLAVSKNYTVTIAPKKHGLLKVSKFRKQIDLFSFEPKTERNIRAEIFRLVFGSNENRKICFRNLLTFNTFNLRLILWLFHGFLATIFLSILFL